MKRITQASDIVALVERGDLNHDLSNEISKTLTELRDQAPPKGKVKGSVTLKLNFSVDGNSVEIEAAIDSKVPKRPRGNSVYFLTQDGALSTEHPQQDNFNFDGPREVRTKA